EGQQDVEDRGQTQGEGEALDLADSQEIDGHGTDEGDHVAGDDGALGALPGTWGGGPEGPALTYLILDALVEDHEGVGGGTDTDDQTGDAREIEGIPDPPAQQNEGSVHQCTGGHQREQGDEAEHAVVGEDKDGDEDDTHDTGDETRLEGGRTQGGWDCGGRATALTVFTGETQWQGTIPEVVGQFRGLLLGEVAGDGGGAAHRGGGLDHRCGDDLGI